MPHVSDARASTHDRHDLMLVAALAAGDLAGTDRDLAISLTSTCDECRAVHDDLVAIARATATVPPAVTKRPRDFRLTTAQAASLRRSGWRRLLPAIDLSALASRRLGVGLATFGLIGLLVGNVQLGAFGSAGAAAPMAAASAGGTSEELQASGGRGAADASSAAAAAASMAPMASAAASMAPEPVASPSEATTRSLAVGGGTGSQPGPQETKDVGIAGEGGASTANGGDATTAQGTEGALRETMAARGNAWNTVFIAAIALGLVLLIASRFRARTAAR